MSGRGIGPIQEWARSHPPERTFMTGDEGDLTYGDLASAVPAPGTGVVVSEPGGSLASVIELVAVPGPDRTLVALDPGLPGAEKSRRVAAAHRIGRREAMTVLFTSGTTGRAKAVRLTADNWHAAVIASALHLRHRPEDVWLAAMPLHHVGGLSILYRTAHVGACVRWLPRFEASRVGEELRRGVTIASLVPTMLRRVLDQDRRPFRGVRAVLVGGGPIPPGLLEEAHDRGLPALPTYGMTETCAQVATMRPGSRPRRAAHPLPGVEIRIGPDERIWVRAAQVSPGYADEDDRPPGSWFITPDRGRLEDDGALEVLGRADRVIVSGGENVDPGRVEAVLLGHPDVEQVAVVGIDDPEWGTAVVAVFEGRVDPTALGEWAASHLAPYERPKRLRRVERVPTRFPGKPDRAAIGELLRSETDRRQE